MVHFNTKTQFQCISVFVAVPVCNNIKSELTAASEFMSATLLNNNGCITLTWWW